MNLPTDKVAVVVACVVMSVLMGFSVRSGSAEENHSDYVGREYPTHVYWGDTHVHTNLSADVFNGGTPDDAYRFARGETVKGPGGVEMRLRRPLDFLVVADHAENIGVLAALEAGDPLLRATESGRKWYRKWLQALPALKRYRQSGEIEDYDAKSFGSLNAAMHEGAEDIGGIAFRRSVWDGVTRRADQYNQPKKFTTFSGYEWSPMALFIHRVVVFKDDAATVSRVLPFSQLDSTRPEDLWAHLENYTRKTGGDVLAIPHNPNLTRGHMFLLEDSYGRPLTPDYARMRSRWEPLLEVTQKKGDSETHPELSPEDEFADYERYEQRKPSAVNSNRGRQHGYARSALKLGLDRQATLGVNPFKFGLIGSTDTHSAFSDVDKRDFWALNPYRASLVTAVNPFSLAGAEFESYRIAKWNVAGYAAVWAQENTREALFAAMKRREVYATTGSRIELRFFGGWNFEKADALKPDLASVGYAKGVPMGGDLTHGPKGKAPRFLIRAVKDPEGANLDRVQVIKGWRDKEGKLQEKVFDVALSDHREGTRESRAQPVGNTVDVQTASYTNAIGDPELSVVWKDPDFSADELAFYYVRVIEIPTPRWTAYYAKHFEVENMPAEIPMVTQERAYSSPIWFAPGKPGKRGGYDNVFRGLEARDSVLLATDAGERMSRQLEQIKQ